MIRGLIGLVLILAVVAGTIICAMIGGPAMAVIAFLLFLTVGRIADKFWR